MIGIIAALIKAGAFLLAQFVLGLDPWGNTINWFKQVIENVTGGLIQYVSGI